MGEFYKGPRQQRALPTFVKSAAVTTGIFGKETK